MELGTAVIIGTRGSQLALWQAAHVAERLRGACAGLRVSLERIKTTGDRILDVPLAQVGGKALFVKEIEEALLAKRVDLAVHSMKDVPTALPAGLTIAAVTEREDPADALISRTGAGLRALPAGARIGTSSLRRQAQLLHHRPDLRVVGLRGNLDTRIRKLGEEGLDAIVVAAAGVKRLGLSHRITEILSADLLLPAIGQGALGIEVRVAEGAGRGAGGQGGEGADEARMPTSGPVPPNRRTAEPPNRDAEIVGMVATLDHRDTHSAVRAERGLLRRLEGGCQVPIAAWARVEGERIALRGLVASLDGRTLVQGERRGARDEPEAVGVALAEELLARGGAAILQAITGQTVERGRS